MALETGTYISDLVVSNPTSADPKSEGDDHLRLLKASIKNTFPNVNGAVTASPTELNILDGATLDTAELNVLDGMRADTAELNILNGATMTTAELNYIDGVTSPIQPQIDLKAPIASPTLTGTPRAPTAPAATSGTQIATLDFVNSTILTASLPGQAGNAGALLSTDGANASWTKTINGGVVKLASGGNIVGTTEAQTLTNKAMAIRDSGFQIYDNVDPTKTAQFECAGIATGTTRIITFPDKDINLGSSGKIFLQNFTAPGNTPKFEIVPAIFDTTYDVYELDVFDFPQPVGPMKLSIRYKNAGIEVTAGYGGVSSSQGYPAVTGGSEWQLDTGSSNTQMMSFTIKFYKPGRSTGPVRMLISGSVFSATGVTHLLDTGLGSVNAHNVQGIVIYNSSGVVNVTGHARLYGMDKGT